jgi:hypothetical protein
MDDVFACGRQMSLDRLQKKKNGIETRNRKKKREGKKTLWMFAFLLEQFFWKKYEEFYYNGFCVNFNRM